MRENAGMAHKFTTSFVEDAGTVLRSQKRLAEKALDQVRDEELGVALDEESNSIAVLMRHLAGNLKSRWTDFLTTDGEKPDRQRDREFEAGPVDRAALLAEWEDGWRRLFSTLDGLSERQLSSAVMIRGEAHSVMQAINRTVAHTAQHVGQIVMLAKHFRRSEWKTLSIARGKSEEYNARMRNGSR
jgi:hypothetical protein